jgi:hypothetical protein
MIISNLLHAGEYHDPGGFIYPEYTSKEFIIKKDIKIEAGEKSTTITEGKCRLYFGNRNCTSYLSSSNEGCNKSDVYKAGTVLIIADGSNDAAYGNWDNHDGSLDVQSFINFSEYKASENKYDFLVAGMLCNDKVYGIHGAILSMAIHKTPLQSLKKFKNIIEEISN